MQWLVLSLTLKPPGMQWCYIEASHECKMEALDTVPVLVSSAGQKHASLWLGQTSDLENLSGP